MRVLGGVMLFALAIVGATASEFYTEFVVRGYPGTLEELQTAVESWLADISAGSSALTITVLAKPAA